MCGIAGYFLAHDIPHTPDRWLPRLQAASQSMQLRGPDDSGTFLRERIGLAHRRLAILDIEGGRQPMTDPTTGWTLVFNGEIYNYRQIRADLQEQGHIFQTQSDTEVLLKAYIEWGKDCLHKLDGMFAFALYHAPTHKLFLARDRVGVKPLFWSFQNHACCFASSVSALQALTPEFSELSLEAISHYLTTIRVNLGSQTILKHIQLLEPGTWMSVDTHGKIDIASYWKPTLLDAAQKAPDTTQDMHEQLACTLDAAIRKRLISDVPLGGFLSGGLDSSIIAARAVEMTQHNYHAYSVGYPQQGYNEFTYVEEAAKAFAMQCRQIEMNPKDYPQRWETLIRQNGLPITTPNEIPIWSLSAALRQDYTVALSGEGADEVFGGYTIAHFAAYDFDRAKRTNANASSPLDQAMQRAYGQSHIPSLAWQHLQLNHWLSPADKAAWLHPDVLAELQQDAKINEFYENLYASHPQASTLDRILHAHMRVNLEGLLLRVDSSSMAASVEARVPFTDPQLINLAFSLPDKAKLDWRTPEAKMTARNLNVFEIVQQDLIQSKRILRDTYANAVPRSILERPKMSFPVPVFEWINDWLQPTIREWIAQSPLRQSLLNPQTVQAFLDGKRTCHPLKLWPIINLCLWHQK